MTFKIGGFRTLATVLVLGLSSPYLLADSMVSDEAAALDRARLATQTFSGALKSELMAAMQAGGPVTAIQVCSQRAEEIAREVSEREGMELQRVSRNYRNPDNAPNAWQLSVLQTFKARRAAGAEPGELTWNEFVGAGRDRELRYMKAIITDGVCLQCHGETVAPEVRAKLDELYPNDRAIGYRKGDVRGAFVVTQIVPAD